jgi:predicted PhzF superfamily epimerase YddE/YHI9
MTSLAYTVVDAFSTTAFRGNPAAVVILPPAFEVSDETLLAVAQEFNLPMTAFVYLNHTHDPSIATDSAFRLRWFNTSQEYHFCGHATLAAAHILFSRSEWAGANTHEITFTTLAGQLKACKVGPEIELNFPAGEVLLVDDVYEGEVSLRDAVMRAASLRDEKTIKAVGEGGGGYSFKHFMVVELETSTQLEELRPVVTCFVRAHIHAGLCEFTHRPYPGTFRPAIYYPDNEGDRGCGLFPPSIRQSRWLSRGRSHWQCKRVHRVILGWKAGPLKRI